MKIVWNKVTPLSKYIALALFVLLPFIGFYYGMQYGLLVAILHNNPATTNTTTTVSGDEYYKNIAEWQVDSNAKNFSIAYPIDFDIQAANELTQSEWRVDANGTPGTKLFNLTIQRLFKPHTNFADAQLGVGESENAAAVKDCLAPGQTGGAAVPTSTAMISGVPFTVFYSSGAGAGNYYETTSYRTIHAGQCWAVEYTIHSTQIMNYPAEYNLHEFDKAKLTDVLDRIAHTFKFL
jgi:hypothetical protein